MSIFDLTVQMPPRIEGLLCAEGLQSCEEERLR